MQRASWKDTLDLIKDMNRRMEAWMKYKFEKEMLPEIIAEVTQNVRIELITNANIPEEISLRVRYVK